jgi:excisionase family DNA binding protein
MTERLTYSPTETAQVLGVSRPTVYTLMKREDFPAFKVGSRTLVSAEGLRAWVQAQTEKGERA